MEVSTVCERLTAAWNSLGRRQPAGRDAYREVKSDHYLGSHAFHLASFSATHFAAASSAVMSWLVM